jgi:methanogenic corrinoid protein MtbC1
MENEQHTGASERLALYPIRVVAARTGIGVHTLRAWERRYGLPRPTRTAGEHRLYRLEDIVLLSRVQALIARGAPPSRACALVLAEAGAEVTVAAGSATEEVVGDPAHFPARSLRARLGAAAFALDEMAATSALCEAFTLFGADLALERVILPALVEIGAAWAEGRASVAAEHFASAVVRARLLAAFEGASSNERAPVALLSTGPGEHHEIPCIALALLLRRRGWRAIYLGPDTPLDALQDAVTRAGARLVCLSAACEQNVPRLTRTLHALRRTPTCADATLAYGGAPFRDDPALRHPLEGEAIYLGDDLRQAAARAHILLLRETSEAAVPPDAALAPGTGTQV